MMILNLVKAIDIIGYPLCFEKLVNLYIDILVGSLGAYNLRCYLQLVIFFKIWSIFTVFRFSHSLLIKNSLIDMKSNKGPHLSLN